jgi:hypothetical protein
MILRVFRRIEIAILGCGLVAGCGGGSSGATSTMPAQPGTVAVRFAEGAPSLEALVNGVPTDIGAAYLQVDGHTVASSFLYGTLTSFVTLPAGAHSLKALDTLGYFVGPLKTASLAGGGRYTLVVVGSYPNYSVLAFAEPKSSGAQFSFYEASPSVPFADFGSFQASNHSNFKKLGSAHLGSVATVSLGKSVSNFGGYVGPAGAPLGALTPSQIDSFDSHNALPFHAAARLSLFLFDPKTGSTSGPVFGSLDR